MQYYTYSLLIDYVSEERCWCYQGSTEKLVKCLESIIYIHTCMFIFIYINVYTYIFNLRINEIEFLSQFAVISANQRRRWDARHPQTLRWLRHKHNAVTATTFSSRTKSKNAVSTLIQIRSHKNKAPDQIKLRPDPKNPGCWWGCWGEYLEAVNEACFRILME